MNWSEHRWKEGSAVIANHINYIKGMEYYVACISHRLAGFRFATYCKNLKHILKEK